MKKLLAIALVAASLTACNSGEDKKVDETTITDTTMTVTPAPATADTTMVVTDSTVKTTVTTDTIKKP